MEEDSQPHIADLSTGSFSGERRPDMAGHRDQVCALTIITHPVTGRIGERALLWGLRAQKQSHLSRNDPDFHAPNKTLGKPISDPYVSRSPLRFLPHGGRSIELCTSGTGTRIVAQGLPINGSRIFTHDEIKDGVVLELAERIVLLLHETRATVANPKNDLGMIGACDGIQDVRDEIRKVADVDLPVLIRGDSGTGKELVAHAIFGLSSRRHKNFVCVNVGGLQRDLVASELFGSTKGAFTGAHINRRGYFRAADEGILFLDEIGEAPIDVQTALLRVLETGDVFPVGSHLPQKVDVRLITSTDADLEDRVTRGLFKEPLLHRLSGYEIWVPPLRSRRDDIGRLFLHFAKIELSGIDQMDRLDRTDPFAAPWFPPSLAKHLLDFDWPGNVRQLRNVVRQLVIGCRNEATLTMTPQLERLLAKGSPEAQESQTVQAVEIACEPLDDPRRKPSEISEEELAETMRACRWDLKATADRLHISRPSVYDLIRKHPNLRTATDLSHQEIQASFDACQGNLDRMSHQLEVSKHALKRRVRELGLFPVHKDPGD